MERNCVVCHDKPFQFRCIQCHKPVCDDCAFKTEHGAFCGRDCAAAYRDFQRSYAGKRKKSSGGLLKVVVVVLIILVVAALAAAYLLGQLPGVPGKP